jgi:D-alanine-D-alanine ligase
MKRTVAVLMGGWSPEREVSLVSGKACADGLRDGGHDVVEYDVKRDLRALIDFLRPAGGGGPDVVFNALHGRYGEDGCIQGVLEVLAVPYTHSGVLPSAIAMDKPMARHVFTSLGLRVAQGKVIERHALASGDPMPRPYVVKPIDQGSSVGVHIVREGDNLAAVEVAEAAFGEKVLVEKFVPGRELTVAVMGDRAVAVTELRPRTRFYDYEAKYTDGITEHLVPAPIPAEVYELAKQWALTAHQALGCSGLTRADLRWDDSRPGTSGLVILELNTQPGMTPLSLAPEQAKWAGISWPPLRKSPASGAITTGARSAVRSAARPSVRCGASRCCSASSSCCWAAAGPAAGGRGTRAGWSRRATVSMPSGAASSAPSRPSS